MNGFILKLETKYSVAENVLMGLGGNKCFRAGKAQ